MTCHSTKPNRDEFGEAEMRRWWQEKDLLSMLRETLFTAELSLEDAVERICRDAANGDMG